MDACLFGYERAAMYGRIDAQPHGAAAVHAHTYIQYKLMQKSTSNYPRIMDTASLRYRGRLFRDLAPESFPGVDPTGRGDSERVFPSDGNRRFWSSATSASGDRCVSRNRVFTDNGLESIGVNRNQSSYAGARNSRRFDLRRLIREH